MADGSEKRKYSRVSPNISLRATVQHTDNKDKKYYEGIIENVSLGGMFIVIDHPFPKGSIVTIQFEFRSKIDKDERPVTAKGLIRWTQKQKRPHGMGIDFIEFEGLGNTPFEEWLKKHFQQE